MKNAQKSGSRLGLVARCGLVTAVLAVGSAALAQVSPAKRSAADGGSQGPTERTEVRYCTANVKAEGAAKELRVDIAAESCRDALPTREQSEDRHPGTDRANSRD